MNHKLIKKLDCIETGRGILLQWELYDGVVPIKTTVYGIDNRTRQYSIVSPLITTGRCLVDARNYPLIQSFRIQVVASDGCTEMSEDIVPQRMAKAERLLLNNIKERVRTWMRATPIGSYPCTLLLRRLDGEPCDRCGYGVCSTTGGTIPGTSCPECLGTGKKDPYYRYPTIEWMHGETPADDNDNEQLGGVNRTTKFRHFRTVCDIHIKPGDVIVSGTEVYQVIKHEVKASVGNAPADYILTCMKYAPADIRQPILQELARGK